MGINRGRFSGAAARDPRASRFFRFAVRPIPTMKKFLPLIILSLSIVAIPVLAHFAHFSLDKAVYDLGEDIILADSDPGCHGVGCNGESLGWSIYKDSVPGSVYAECQNYTSLSYSATCSKILEPSETTPTAGNYSAIVRPGAGNCQAKTYADCADDGEVMGVITFEVVAPSTAAPLFTLPTSTAPDLAANVSDTLADSGTLGLVVAAIAFPLLFWVMTHIKDVFPGTEKRGRFPSSEEISRENERFYVRQKFGGYKKKI